MFATATPAAIAITSVVPKVIEEEGSWRIVTRLDRPLVALSIFVVSPLLDWEIQPFPVQDHRPFVECRILKRHGEVNAHSYDLGQIVIPAPTSR